MIINENRNYWLYIFEAGLLITLLGTFSTSLFAAPRIVAAFGSTQINGNPALVEVIVVVNPGQSVKDVVRSALADQGARPINSASLGSLPGFEIFGFAWPGPVAQNLNNANAPVAVAGGVLPALLNSHDTWNAVASSTFVINYGGDTDRCPSLARECPGPQIEDTYNDIGWVNIPGCCTLAVTWFLSGIEADIALDYDNRFLTWVHNGDFSLNQVDPETVLLHENGHFAGLDHSDKVGAVMEAAYAEVRRNLTIDDISGITYLYDNDVTGEVNATVVDDAVPPNSIAGATVELEDTNPVLECTTTAAGTCTILSVPDPVGYTIAASNGTGSDTQPLNVMGTTNITLILPSGGGGGMCMLGMVGDSCDNDNECCSNKCKGPPSGKTCK